MTLLYKSNIQTVLDNNIKGHVARVGGAVNQLIRYDDCVVEDINIPDGGYGAIGKVDSFFDIRNNIRLVKRYIRQEMNYLKEGYKASRDRKTVILDLHDAFSRPDLKSRYDCSISSNVIEHSPNPIFLLLNFYYITRLDGYQFHAIPNYKYTYDCHRKPTSLEHMIRDFKKKMDRDDVTHGIDYYQSAVVKHGWQKKFHQTYPVAYPYMHFHVFDVHNTKDLIEFLFEDVVVDVIKTEQFSDNVIVFKNRLNVNFLAKYGKIAESYSKDIMDK